MRSVWLSMASAVFYTAAACAQSAPVPLLPSGSVSAPSPQPDFLPAAPPPSNAPLYRELDMLRRDGFSGAQEAMVSLKVLSKDGITPRDLDKSEYTLIANGTPRTGRLHAPRAASDTALPLVLLVFPPNQPIIHFIGVRDAIKYFTKQPDELLPWRVGIFDSNGKLTPFTDGKSQLLLNLDLINQAVEGFQFASDQSLPANRRWEGSWMTKAEDAVSLMQRFDGPKVILAMNPLAQSIYGLNTSSFANDGPEALIEVAKHVGAHIYIANVGGPDAFPPGGGAAEHRPAQVNTPGGPLLGTLPSGNMQFDPRLTMALANSAARTSVMMQTAESTLGGFANSLDELAARIHRDLDETWALNFDLTPEDRDHGVPNVEIKLATHDLRVAILDVVPVGTTSEANREAVSKALMDKIRKATERSVTSPEFRITQHVDYFPLRFGLDPVLPMTSLIEWTGPGRGPDKLSVVESVDDVTLSAPVMERAIQVRWNGHNLSWERDGHLHPGQYLWRISVHDGNGKVFASSEQKIAVDAPHQASVEVSSLVVGKSCRQQDQAESGGLRRRSKDTAPDDGDARTQIDPMRAIDCRIKPEADDKFASTDLLHAFVRIYPAGKLDKHGPESWTAKFVLRSSSTPVSAEKETPFRVDSGSGYLAYVEMALDTPGMPPGRYTLDVVMQGPGIRKELKESRSISIEP